MTFYPQPESSRINSKPSLFLFFFFTICLQSHYAFTPPAEIAKNELAALQKSRSHVSSAVLWFLAKAE